MNCKQSTMSQIKESYFNWSSRDKLFFTFLRLKINNSIFGAVIFEIIEDLEMKSCVWKKKSSFFQNNSPLFVDAFLNQIKRFKVCGKVHIFWEGKKFYNISTVDLFYVGSNLQWRFCKILWCSQNIYKL